MKSKFLLMLALALIQLHCGGSSGELGEEPKELLLDFADSDATLSLSATDYEYNLLIYTQAPDGNTLVLGPLELSSYNADENIYSIRVDDLLYGSYLGELRLVRPGGDSASLVLTSATFEFELSETQQTIDLSNVEWDDSSFDDDADGLSNLDELGLSTDPNLADTDEDGVADGVDAFPTDATEAYDFDGDGFGDAHDDDIDNDGLANASEATLGTDPIQPDTDFDAVLDGSDNCPLVANLTQDDLDSDGTGDDCDVDTDGDGLSDDAEVILGTSLVNSDTDGDGTTDLTDLFPTNANETLDNDADNTGDNADTDDDNDGLSDAIEASLGLYATSADTDDDGVADSVDNCGLIINPGQSDNDSDLVGDDCDADDDNDSLADDEEVQIGTDGFITNGRIADSDGDGFDDNLDNCPNDDNVTQADADGDGFGTACDCDDNDPNLNQLAEDLPDSQIIDKNCDGIDGDRYNSVFVATTGTETATATVYGSPTADLQGALDEGVASDKTVLIAAGDFNVAGLALPDGARVYGGYSETFLDRDTLGETQITRFISSESDGAVITIQNLTSAVLSGITFINNSEEDEQIVVDVAASTVSFENCVFNGSDDAESERLLVIEDSNVTLQGNQFYGEASAASTGLVATATQINLTNNLWVMGDAEHTRGLELDNVSGLIVNNTINGGQHASGSAYGIVLSASSPQIVNNVFITENDRNQAGLFSSGLAPDDEINLENNAFLRFTSRSLTYPAVIESDGTSLTTLTQLEASSEFTARDNIIEASLSAATLSTHVDVTDFYTPVAGSPLIDVGQDAVSNGSVTFDLFGEPRSEDVFDIGAVEF